MKAKVNGIETHYEVHGSEGAPWLTFSHSLACSVRMWDGQVAEFKDRWHILVYDTRGHGASEAPKGPYSLDMLAEDLSQLLQHLGIKRTHYVGLSMGGMIGQTLVLKDPAIFDRVVLADTGHAQT
ncbi:MAG: alpha/beta fold hydrolase, partial [Burkholderiales bacterium]